MGSLSNGLLVGSNLVLLKLAAGPEEVFTDFGRFTVL